MSLARLKVWTLQDVLASMDLNAELNNILNNALSLISPLTGNLDVSTNELIFGDAGASATAVGRLRRNATRLTWHDGTTAYPLNQIGRGSLNLIGINNSVTPNSQFDLSADAAILADTNNVSVIRTNTGVITNNILTAGPAANGRDIAAAFADASWVHFYFIWNGSVLATLSSATAPPTGPVLPTGYTHWSYAAAVRLNAVQTLVRTRIRGNFAWLEVDLTGARPLTTGVATVFTAVSFAAFVPPNASLVMFTADLNPTHITAGVQIQAFIRPTGSALATGQIGATVTTQVTNQLTDTLQTTLFPLGTTSQIDYRINVAPSVSGGFSIDVNGYMMPNGGA